MYKNILLFFISICIYNCKQSQKTDSTTLTQISKLSGEELAKSYCASCHLFPDPQLLDKVTWKQSVLPKMYIRLGLEQDSFKLFANYDIDEMQTLVAAGVFPEKPQIARQDWDKIVKYYEENAPEKPLEQDKKEPVNIGLTHFKIKKLLTTDDGVPSVTMIRFNPEGRNIYIGTRGQSNYLRQYGLNFKPIDSLKLNSPISDIIINRDYLGLLTMGIMDPNDKKIGDFTTINPTNKSKKTLLDSLQRPVQISKSDLNNDKIDDYVICNFGNELGNIIWVDGKTHKKDELSNLPGGRKSVIKDINGDNKPDIVVLMTQAQEQIVAYYNNGNNHFVEKVLLRFPSVYGSSYFELVDFNKDGFQDILYTNGDNADLSIISKKYHGIRIFLNDGKNNFTQSYFYPMYGAAKAVAADFDSDGDLDIAAISFFTEPKQKPNEGFLLLNNTGDSKKFKVSTFSGAENGKWMVMDVSDMDQDGDLDIIIGSFLRKTFQNIRSKDSNKLPSAILLENRLVRSRLK